MTKDRASANDTAMSRRTMLAAVPITGAALAISGPAEANEPSQIMRLFQERQAADAVVVGTNFDHLSLKEADDLLDQLAEPVIQTDEAIFNAPSRSIQDLAIKVFLALDGFGYTSKGQEFDALMDEAAAFAVGSEAFAEGVAEKKRRHREAWERAALMTRPIKRS